VTTQLAPTRESAASLLEIIDTILDKGVVINADIAVSVAGVELLGIKIRAALASFATAAKYGLEFPSGVQLDTPAWRAARVPREACPQCRKQVETEVLLDAQCPWCGWTSASARQTEERARYAPQPDEEPPWNR